METALELLTTLSVNGVEELFNNNQLNRLYETTTEGIGDWISFIDALAGTLDAGDIIPLVDKQTLRLGWLKMVSSATFVSGSVIGCGSIFTPAIRFDRVLFQKFLSNLLSPGYGSILPLYEALVNATGETRDMRETKASIAIILGLTRRAGASLECIMTQSYLECLTGKSNAQNQQKIQEEIIARQRSNFGIGLRASTRLLREIAAGDTGYCDSYWEKTSALV